MRGKTMKKAEKVPEEKSKGSFKDRRKECLKEIGNIGKECPPKDERTLKHIFCKEPN